LANLRYQQPQTQQTEKGVFTNEKAKTGFHVLVQWLAVTLVLLLIFLHLIRAIEAGLFSRAFRKKLSEPMSFMGEFFLRLENSADSMGTPCAFCRGRLA
jgi:hypothetical protein